MFYPFNFPWFLNYCVTGCEKWCLPDVWFWISKRKQEPLWTGTNSLTSILTPQMQIRERFFIYRTFNCKVHCFEHFLNGASTNQLTNYMTLVCKIHIHSMNSMNSIHHNKRKKRRLFKQTAMRSKMSSVTNYEEF